MKKTIAVCVARIHMWEQEKLVRSLCESARAQDYEVMVFNISTKLDVDTSHGNGELSVFRNVPFNKISALVILSESIRNEKVCRKLADRAKKNQVPVISVDHSMPECFNITMAYSSSFEQVVRHVVEFHQCKEINFIAGFDNNEFSDDRIDVFKQVLQENGLPFQEEYLAYGQFWEGPTREIAESWVSQWESGEQRRPEAIICANDIMAITVSNVLQNHGIKVPEDVIITGFDGLELGQCMTPKLTTAKDDTEKVGHYAVKMITEYLSGEVTTPYDIEIPFHVVYRESCGCEAASWHNLSEEIMHWYTKSGAIRNLSNDLFMMMNLLSEGHSLQRMAEKLREYRWIIPSDNMVICVNPNFYRNTDIDEDENTDSYIKLVQIRNGEYSVPLEVIPKGTEVEKLSWIRQETGLELIVPLHWQTEDYGFMIISQELNRIDYGAFYEFTMSIDQVFGNVHKQAQLYSLYVRDPLTSLYNRRGFYEEIENRMKLLGTQPKTLFIASVDMDRLKYVNDNFGHQEGDFAICSIGSVLEDVVRNKNGICARFGGDEYMVAMLEATSESDIDFYQHYNDVLQQHIDVLNENCEISYQMGASCGTVWREIETAKEIDKLINEADAAMYADKEIHHKRQQL
ncbi:MAG: GGDEF domain-containing protein [Lachnospiraceae bacterium]|nr:GGDEF domain-containing protein [Lachnospiraceae bacterium]